MEGEWTGAAEQCSQSKILTIDGVDEADVQLLWDPPWNQNMTSEAGSDEAWDDVNRRKWRGYGSKERLFIAWI